MKPTSWRVAVIAVAVVVAAVGPACSRHYVVVTPPEEGYSQRDTLYGRLDDEEIRVTFWFDTIFRVDTVTRVDTLWEEGARVGTVVRIDSVPRVDTIRVTRADTVVRADSVVHVDTVRVADDPPPPEVVVDTVEIAVTDTVVRVDTVLRVDTDEEPATDTILQVDTVEVPTTDTVEVAVTDTVHRVDTVEVAATDTVVRVDTVRVAGRRLLFVPPGHHPPDGECRVWVHGRPPGRQAAAAPCDELGEIPDGAFVLYGGEAWDYDWDWIAEAEENPGAVPPEIVALQRRGGR